MKTITLSGGTNVFVDDEDYVVLSCFRWYERVTKGRCYAVRPAYIDGKRRQVSMHRELLSLVHGDGKYSDHRDGNTLNNQRNNLRIATNSQNTINSMRSEPPLSGVKGVYRNGNKWMSRIKLDGVDHYLGTFPTISAATDAHEEASHKYHGEFARSQ